MKNQSLTLVSLAVIVLGQLLRGAGFEVVDENLTQFIIVSSQALGAIGVYYGRFRQGDINLLGRKK